MTLATVMQRLHLKSRDQERNKRLLLLPVLTGNRLKPTPLPLLQRLTLSDDRIVPDHWPENPLGERATQTLQNQLAEKAIGAVSLASRYSEIVHVKDLDKCCALIG